MKLFELITDQQDIKSSAISKVSDIILSSTNAVKFTNEERQWLWNTVDNTMTIYRGLGLIPQRLTPEQRSIINTLKEGDNTPDFLLENIHGTNILHYTKSFNVAKYYSEGTVGIVLETIVPKKNIIVDLTKLPLLIKKENIQQDYLDVDDYKYMLKEKEVLVLDNDNVNSTIKLIKGKFRF